MAMLSILWILQIAIVTQELIIVLKKLWFLKIKQICCLYISSTLMYAGFYLLLDYALEDPFDWNEVDLNKTFIRKMFAMLYFSTSQQTLCGVASITPKQWTASIVAAVQMMVGITFSIVIISIAIARLGEDLQARFQMEQAAISEIKAHTVHHRDWEQELPLTCWKRFTRHRFISRIRRFFRKFLLPIILVIQVIKVKFGLW